MKGFERESPQQRNIERERHSFIEAVSAHSIVEIPTEFDEIASHQLLENISRTNLFILGEMHGVKENPDIIYTLFKKFGFRGLSLEWEPDLKHVAEKYLETGELNFHAIQDSPDGRVTGGHFALLKKLRDEGMLEQFVCFDGGATGPAWNDRDEAMAKNILANLSDVPTLVVAGNLHAKTEPLTFDGEADEQHPMGERIQNQIPEVVSGKIEYDSGQFHNYGPRDFMKLSDAALPTTARFYIAEDGLYTFELPEAHMAAVPNPHERI
ncbi:MAG: hypothetical protein JWN49_537 [Parcubacteria group bacterium]|nr:hypothetical protein [Parcubacteria group bacterium]